MTKTIKAIYFCISILLCNSCVSNLDFSQANDYTLTPVYTGSLVYFTLNSIEFIDQNTGNEITDLPADISQFTLFENKVFRDNVTRFELDFQIKNEFNRTFIANINFLDDSNTITYSFSPLIISANDLNFVHQEIIEIATNQNILNTGKLSVKIDILPSTTTLDSSDTSELEFKSSGTLYLQVNQ